jgi:hypothetical protein
MIRKDVRVKSGARVWVYEARVASNKLDEARVILDGGTIGDRELTGFVTIEPYQTLITFGAVLMVAEVTLDSFADGKTRLLVSSLVPVDLVDGVVTMAAGPYFGKLRNTFVGTVNIEPVA